MKRKAKIPKMTIMAHDPSMTAWGWVILDINSNIISSGAIKTSPVDKKMRIRKGDDRTRRITEVVQALLTISKKYNVVYHVSELPHGSQSAIAAVMLGFSVAILQTISECTKISVEWYSEGDAKMSVSGKRSVAKDIMVTLMKKKYPSFEVKNVKWIDQAVADALAVHHVALEQSPVIKLLAN